LGGYYPVMMNIEGRRCVVVGGGAVAERKTKGLLEAGADVLVVSPALTPGLEALGASGRIRLERRPFASGDLKDAALAFAASDSPEANAAAAAEAVAAGIPVNRADHGDAGTFITPAVVRRGGLLVAVSASGAGPGLASRLAKTIDEEYGGEWEAFTAWLGRVRAMVMSPERGFGPELRRRLMRAALDVPEAAWSADRDEIDIDRRLNGLLAQLSGGTTDESGAEAADDRGRHKTERAGADPDGPGH